MNKSLKRNFIVTLFVIIALCLTMSAISMTSLSRQVFAQELTTQDFYIDGASVRAKGVVMSGDEEEVSGIKFHTNLSSNTYALIVETIQNGGSVEFGMLYVLDELRGANEAMEFPIAKDSQIKYTNIKVDANETSYLKEIDGGYTVASYLYNIPEKYYRSQINAVGYLSLTEKDAEEPTIIYTEEFSRSIAEVAYLATVSGADADYIKEYVSNDYAVTTANGTYALKIDMVDNTNAYTYTLENVVDEITSVRIGAKEVNATINGKTISIPSTEIKDAFIDGEVVVSIYTKTNVYNHTVSTITSEITTETGLKALVDTVMTGDNQYDYYLLKNDIPLTASSWKATGTFVGTFDGNGKTISGLKVLNGSNGINGGLFNQVSAGQKVSTNIKNLAIVGAEATNQSGILAGRLYTNVVIDNVFIGVASLQGSASGIAYSNFATTTVKNTTVYIESATTSKNVMFTNSNGKPSVSGCFFIGGPVNADGNLNINLSGKVPTSGYTTFNTFVDYCVANADKTVLPNGLAKTKMDTIVAEKGVVLVNKENVTTTLYTATEGYLILAEDIDFASDELKDFKWKPTSTFTGTFDGNGHSIKNLTPSGGQVGLFKQLSGSATIKNLVMTGITVGNQTGAIAFRSYGNINIENVFIQATAFKYPAASNTNGCGLIFTNYSSSSTFKNLIIVMDSIDCSAGEKVNFLSTNCNTSPKLTNCYFIAGPYKGSTTYINVNGTSKIASGSTYQHFADNATFNSAITNQTVTLNTFLSTAWNGYNK